VIGPPPSERGRADYSDAGQADPVPMSFADLVMVFIALTRRRGRQRR
jgi:hypothetical protein